ncbi:MAG: hypothetical protein ACPGXK_11615 [Phycisphaerae bacterium]
MLTMNRFYRRAALSLAAACAISTAVAPAAYAGGGPVVSILPTRASGIECATPDQDPATCDWYLAGVAIILNRGGQDVQFEIFVRDWDPGATGEQIAAYQFSPLCDSYFSTTDVRLLPLADDCGIGQGTFDVDFCLGVDQNRTDWLHADAAIVLPACQNSALCPDGGAGAYACGSVVVAGTGGTDDGTDQYLTHFAYTVPANAAGMWSLSVDTDPNFTFLKNPNAVDLPIATVNPGIISVRCAMDSQCDDGNPCTEDICNELVNICQNPAKEAGDPCGDQTSTECNAPDTCDESGICQENVLAPGTQCGACSGGDVCDSDGNCGDGLITLDDYMDIADCGTGPMMSLLDDCCASFDLGLDSDVDLMDYADFFNAFTGE